MFSVSLRDNCYDIFELLRLGLGTDGLAKKKKKKTLIKLNLHWFYNARND